MGGATMASAMFMNCRFEALNLAIFQADMAFFFKFTNLKGTFGHDFQNPEMVSGVVHFHMSVTHSSKGLIHAS